MVQPSDSHTAQRLMVLLAGGIALIPGSCVLDPGDVLINAGRGPVRVHIPLTYDETNPVPLIIILHGYSGNSGAVLRSLDLQFSAETRGFIYAAPNGTFDSIGNRFWNATDACCDFTNTLVDDSTYLRGLIELIMERYSVDDRRIYVGGLSNGGFMAYRMACDHADLIAGVVSMAGATFDDPDDCTPSEPVHVLQVHGTEDRAILYSGNFAFGIPYPGAIESVETWASYNGCAPIPLFSSDTLDLDNRIPGDETLIMRYPFDCAPGGSSEHWRVRGGPHLQTGSPLLGAAIVDHLLSQQKPPKVGEIDTDE